jgi:osmoprotectant transport system permease protein
MASGAVLVAALALLVDLLLALVQRYTVSRGVTGRYSRRQAQQQQQPERILATAGSAS